MEIEINSSEFDQAQVLLSDIIFNLKSDKKSESDLQKLKLLQARHNNSEFEMEIAEIISEQCTITDTDCLAVLNVLEKNIIRELKQGRIVRLGKLGNFQVSLSLAGFVNEAEVSAEGITKTRIIFRPSVKMKGLLESLKFSKQI